MTRTFLVTATALSLVLSLGAATAMAAPPESAPQDDQSTHIGTNVAPRAQLEREHRRAVTAGDWANDPFDSRSSDALNQAQLQGAPIPGAAPGMASLPMTDENTGVSSDMSAGMTGDTMANDNSNNNQVEDDTATLPQSDTPAVSLPDQGTSSTPGSSLPPTHPETMPQSDMPQSEMPKSTDATEPQ